ncbi:uncharacterized protein CTRU02_214677 [Colletotrichum truncatum]|uniref:Uncharacterized protein n=1 Tax=Colletotrichum truncatum TaxID=5467 RepID=A0ACC3YGS5_COLTU
MRSAVILAAIAGLSAANPVVTRDATAQNGIDLSAFDAEPKVTKTGPEVGASSEAPTYSPTEEKVAAAEDAVVNPVKSSNLKARDETCDYTKKEPDGYGPVSSPDDYATFMQDPQFDAVANSAITPPGYTKAFGALTGSVEGSGYQGLYTLKSYDTIKCQQYCDAAPVCYGFNIFFERDPKISPTNTCVNPASITNYKCTLWGYQVTAASATNTGQWRNKFHVGIRGSNGYAKNAAPPAEEGFDGPTAFGGAIQAPNSYMGVKYYAGVYDPGLCAAACKATTAYDRRHPRADGTYDACNFFNSYVLSENGVPQGTYCSMYTKPWSKSYSTNYGQYRGSDYYSVSQSYGYTLSQIDPGTISATN